MKNTMMGYLYRDASNYKKWNEVILAGEFTQEDKDFIKGFAPYYEGDGNIIPEQLKLPLNRPDDEYTEDDHCWAEFDIDELKLVDREPTVDVTWKDVMEKFREAKEKGWRDWAY